MRLRAALLLALVPLAGLAAGAADYVRLPGGAFRSVLKYEDAPGRQKIAPFALMKQPVTNAEFLAFVQAKPAWRRGKAPSVFADTRYLQHWGGATTLGGKALPQQPVVHVSWFAAQAYCESQGARLPTWLEWEYAAAADETRKDARGDRAWRERILSWYSQPTPKVLPRAGLQTPNAFGVQDLHGLAWEWTDDFSALLVSGDNRDQGDPDTMKFCGAGALSMDDRENYAVLMRVAMLSSLQAANTTGNLGFRCAKDMR
ncbi:MAG TPA: formylglycine-generating enzyme family protein [Thermomonas sp.]|nr:formylglycine-generating enzyme family protein [Thermomonas sp.]